MANRTKRIATMFAVTMVGTSASLAGGPVDEKLVIDGEVEIMTRVPAPEGHPFDELISGWHYRTEETRDLEADSFQNPGMLYVERGEEIWNTVDGAAGKSCASCHGADGKGMAETKRVNFTDPVWHVGKQDRDIASAITRGRPPRMPAMPMAESQLRDLVGYLRSLKRGEAPPPPAEQRPPTAPGRGGEIRGGARDGVRGGWRSAGGAARTQEDV